MKNDNYNKLYDKLYDNIVWNIIINYIINYMIILYEILYVRCKYYSFFVIRECEIFWNLQKNEKVYIKAIYH